MTAAIKYKEEHFSISGLLNLLALGQTLQKDSYFVS